MLQYDSAKISPIRVEFEHWVITDALISELRDAANGNTIIVKN